MKPLGRPRKNATHENIVNATASLIAEQGYSNVTVEQVVTRAGTNKPAFYRRFSHLFDVVPHILASRHGTDEDINTGSLVGDLLEVQRRQLNLFTDPVVSRGMAAWLAHASSQPQAGQAFIRDYLAPRRAYTVTILERAASRDEITLGADPAWIADVLTGPLLMRALLPDLEPIDEHLMHHTINAALDALEYRGDRSLLALPR